MPVIAKIHVLPSEDEAPDAEETRRADEPPVYQDSHQGWTVVGSPRPKVPAKVKFVPPGVTVDFDPIEYQAECWDYDAVPALRRGIKEQLLQTKGSLRRAGIPVPKTRRLRNERLLQLRNFEGESDIEEDLWVMRCWLHE